MHKHKWTIWALQNKYYPPTIQAKCDCGGVVGEMDINRVLNSPVAEETLMFLESVIEPLQTANASEKWLFRVGHLINSIRASQIPFNVNEGAK